MRKRHFATVALGSTLALMSATALADTAAAAPGDTAVAAPTITTAASVLNVASGAKRGRLDGEMKFRYPGFEQTTVAFSKNHIVLITMEAVLEKGKAPVQCSCSSYEMRADGPPRLVADLKRLSDYPSGNDRACNHPKAAADENGNIVWGYGSDYNNNRPNTYAGIINEKCEVLAAPQMVNIPRNANDGAFDISYVGKGLFVGAYYSDGGDGPGFPAEGGDYAVAMGLQVNAGAVLPTLTRTWIQPAIMGGAIMRPSVAVMSDSRVLVAASQGGNRPSVNSEVALLDTLTGTKVFSTQVSKGDPNKKIYFNSPTIKKLTTDPTDRRAVMLDWESNGMGRGTNIKGTSKTHLYMLELNGDSLNVVSETTDVGAHQTHASLCTGTYGESGTATAAIFTAAPTGIGRATMSMFGVNNETRAFNHDPKTDAWPAAWYGDSGHLSNWYGANPMRQGRDFMWCEGNVPNLGYHVPGGFMSDVKTLFVGTVHGRVPGDAKNSLFLSLVPGQMDKKASPTNPVIAGEAPGLDPNATTPSADGSGDASNGCGCSTPGQTSRGPAGLVLGLVALGLVAGARRRKN
ncbi:hypothetical protein BH11MYX4_BH11MYX4_58850 [soil metagenome]